MRVIGFVHNYPISDLLRILNELVPYPSHTLLSNLDEIVVRFEENGDDKYYQVLLNLLTLSKKQKIKVCFLTKPIENPNKLLTLYKTIPFNLCLDNTRHQTVDYLAKFNKMFPHITRSVFTKIYLDEEYYVIDKNIMITDPLRTITRDIHFTYKENNCPIVIVTSQTGKEELFIHNESTENKYIVKKKKLDFPIDKLEEQFTLTPNELFVLQL